MVEPSNNRAIGLFRWMFAASLLGFAIGVVLLVCGPVLDHFRLYPNFVRRAAIFGVGLVFLSNGLLIISMLARDALEWKADRWRFSLRSVFLAMTAIAVLFGIIVILRNTLPIRGK